jgi:hypothetical protein
MTLIVGINHLRDGIEPQSTIGSDMAIVGIVGTAPGADSALFPLNKAVDLRTNEAAKRAALGTSGTLVDALAGISATLQGVGAAKCVLVRVTQGATAAETIANIIGSEANSTGVWALLSAPEELTLTPRLIIVPGFTSQTHSGVGAVTVGTAGSGYTSAPTVAFSGGGGTGAAGTAVLGTGPDAGKVVGVTITNPGSGYTSAPTIAFSGGGGTGAAATATVEMLANGVVAVMPTILDRLKAHFIPEGPSSSRQAWLDWLETVPNNQRILHPLRQDAKVLDADGNVVTKPLSPYVVGAYIARDAGTDGVPARSAANQALSGLVGVSPNIPFSITDANSLGQSDLEVSGGIVVRGNAGVDGALTDSGFVFWGTDTMSSDSEWLFANVSRMRDYMELLQVKALRNYLGKYNLTRQTVQAIINTMNSQLTNLEANGYILGFKLGFDEGVNTPEELRAGHIDLQFMAEEPPVLRKITLRSRRHREALQDLTRAIAIDLGSDIAA